MAPSAIDEAPQTAGRNPPKPPPKLWSVSEPPFEGFRTIDKEGWAQSNNETAIVIDNGTTQKPRSHQSSVQTNAL